MSYPTITELKSHKFFTTHEIVELMIQEYLSQIQEPMISEEMTNTEIQFVHLTMMNTHNLFNYLKRTPGFDISFLKSYTDDDELNLCIFETMSLLKELQAADEKFDSVTLIEPADYIDYIRELELTENPQSAKLDAHVNWGDVALEKRPAYTLLEINFKSIGFEGTWMKKITT